MIADNVIPNFFLRPRYHNLLFLLLLHDSLGIMIKLERYFVISFFEFELGGFDIPLALHF
jgi:hypothetical protein